MEVARKCLNYCFQHCSVSTELDKLEYGYFQYTVTELSNFILCCVAGALEEECESQGREKEQHLNGKQRHQLKHRELFLSRQVETLPATHIRGKCSVTLLNETESLLSYLNKDVRFIFCYSICRCNMKLENLVQFISKIQSMCFDITLFTVAAMGCPGRCRLCMR